MIILMRSIWMLMVQKYDDDEDDDKKKKKEKAKESVEEAKKELDEEPNEGNEFAHELKKARDAGKDEFEVDGKKVQSQERTP